ncbi:hypothetical protein N802_18020 [Knoellia sinensis KCTC 19936]|uniref:OmpR/PhoB-type domain-containing protein n=1 Tax=Knoellia sinensis KCTC 19936 TaxID=1385520 RepID=A0A0A0J4G4_9MICO|nr:BTAD domain-containing putative transcriptional regulator [Knoellia sinensis]KGN32260.1 hypothetical protein N802_18020 [Knoellia sinensis KCTC 19936]
MGIAVLGPLLVDDHYALSPRDQVVLEALVAAGGQALSAESLAEALWGEVLPASWKKLIPSSILRIRKLLGSDSIETTSHGYRLTAHGDAVDAVRFVRLVDRGHSLLAAGDADRARHVLREALGLWRGRALAELADWEPGRFEAERLDEMRRNAEEAVLDASLRAGLHAEVIAEARARVAQEPLRERRWALLAVAQYLSGEQGDALQTLRDARRHVAEELGLDPGPELAQLEDAILRQDASLVAAVALPEPRPENPYPGLRAFDVDDGEYFFGREKELDECLRRLHESGVLVLVGPSGCGKSSLVRAGIIASLRRDGRRVELLPVRDRPVEALHSVLAGPPGRTLVVDQFEEVVASCSDDREQATFNSGLVEFADTGSLVLAIRADHVGDVAEPSALARLVERGLFLLGPMDEASLRAAIEGPAAEAALVVEPGLVDVLVGDVFDEPGGLPMMAHALHQTWKGREGRTLTVDGYRASGGIRGAVARSAERVHESLGEDQRAALHDLLLRLVSVAPDGEPVRNWIPARVLGAGEVQELVEVLVRARLVTVADGAVAVAHESLVRAWPRLKEWLDDDIEGQRVLRHLAGAADSWDSLGRPESELYRGVRLSRALEWRRRSAAKLTPVEEVFLTDSERRDAEELSRETAAARRRRRHVMTTRGLVAGLTTLAIVAAVTVAFGVRQRDEAARAAAAARTIAAAHDGKDPAVAALAGVEAIGLSDGAETRSALLAALQRWPALITSVRVPQAFEIAVGADGSLALAEGTHVSIRDPASLAETARVAHPANGVAFLGRGDEVAINTWDGDLGVVNLATRAREPFTGMSADGFWGLSASGDGTVLGAAGWQASTDESRLSVWQGTRLVRTFPPQRIGAGLLSPDGATLYAWVESPPALFAFDVGSGRTIGTATAAALGKGVVDGVVHGPLAISPDGRSLALGGDEVLVIDASSLKVTRRLPNPTDFTRSLAFSPDGSKLAGGAEDLTVTVWDVEGAGRERISGFSEDLSSMAFSPDGSTLYTVTLDRLSAWDVSGERRLLQPVVPGGPESHGDLVVPSPDGEVVAFSSPTPGSGDRAETIQLLDVVAGKMLPPLEGIYQNWGVWRPPDFDQLAVPGDRTIRVWDWRSSTRVMEKDVGVGAIEALAYTPDGRGLVVGERAGWVYEVDADTLVPVGPRVHVDGDLREVVWGGPGRAVVFLERDQSYGFALVDVEAGRVVRQQDLGFDAGHADVSPDGRLLAIGGTKGAFGIVHLATGDWLREPTTEHQDSIGRVYFSPDGARIVTTGHDGWVRVWDGLTGDQSESILVSRVRTAASAVFLPDSRTLLLAAADGTVRRWDTDPRTWVEFACARAGRNLTTDEWRGIFGESIPYRKTCPK